MHKYILIVLIIIIISCSKNDNTNADLFDIISTNTTESITDISFINKNKGIISGTGGFLAKTNDGGNSWTKLNVGVAYSFIRAFMLNEQVFYTGRIGLYKTNTSGDNFNELSDLSTFGSSIFGVHFFNEDTGIIVKGNQIFKTNDGGTNWTLKYDEAGYSKSLQMTSNLIGYVSGGITFNDRVAVDWGEIHKTTDGGETWAKTLSSNSNIYSISFISDDIGYYINFKKELFKTTDGSNNWSKISNLSNTPLNICFINENTGYLSTLEGQILMTKNGGKSWKIVYNKTSEPIVKIISVDNVIYAVGNDGLFLKIKL